MLSLNRMKLIKQGGVTRALIKINLPSPSGSAGDERITEFYRVLADKYVSAFEKKDFKKKDEMITVTVGFSECQSEKIKISKKQRKRHKEIIAFCRYISKGEKRIEEIDIFDRETGCLIG